MSETQPAVDFLILADRAEAINGKLYLMGGGWDVLSPPSASGPATFSVALGILVPWMATNTDHRCAVRLEDADGKRLLEMTMEFRTGRPPTMEQGATQRVMVALPISIVFPASGAYAIVASIGEQERRSGFQVRLQATSPR
ncbi:MAG TPA: hypothetical protein VHB98_14450 [Chloroflexota bacterium]|nr:hypothetical protein [Chloroflexota bacterium]